MRPLRLTLAAFGPFREITVVDFSEFRANRLFLIHGPVGSGKTFLLDGICFALYGCSSGGERECRAMRCLSASPDEETSVCLDFESSGERYRVERRFSAHDSQGGSNVDDVNLWRLPSVGDPGRRDVLASTSTGVSAMLIRLLGLSAEQFCQVGILPQGKFRRFLLSSAEERREIVGKMFDVARYQRYQDLILREFDELQTSLGIAWKEREEIVARYSDNHGDPRDWLSKSREEYASVTAAYEVHQNRSLEWERELEGAVRYETLERQRDVSRRELEELENPDRAAVGALSGRLRAALLEFGRWREATSEMDSIAKELEAQRSQYEKLRLETNFLEAEVEQARQREEEKYVLHRTQERLNEIREERAGLVQLEAEVEAADLRLKELGRSRAELAQKVKKAQVRVEELRGELVLLDKAEKRLTDLREELASLESQEQAARQRNLMVEALEQAQAREARLRESAAALSEEILSVERLKKVQSLHDRHASLRRLRADLVAGKPCPLCGAVEHPNVYQHDVRRTDQGENLEQKLMGLVERRDHAVLELASVKERRARLEGRLEEMPLGGDLEIDKGLLSDLGRTVDSIEAKLSERARKQKELSRLEAELGPDRKRLRQLRLLRERLQATLEGVERQRTGRRTRLDEMLRQALGLTNFDGQWQEALDLEAARAAERLEALDGFVYGTERAELMAETFALGLADQRAAEKRRESLLVETEHLKHELLERFRLDFASWDDLSFALTRSARDLRFAQGDSSVLDQAILVRAVKRQFEQSQELIAAVPAPPMRAEQIRHALSHEREQTEIKIGRRIALQRAVEVGTQDVALYDAAVERFASLRARLLHCPRW